MSRIRTLFASLALSTSLLAGCTPSQAATLKPARPAPEVVEQDTTRAKLRAKLAERRKVAIERFLAYRDARVYPVPQQEGFGHVWLDSFGNLCAAATLISHDWGRAAMERIAAENNAIALATVKDGPLLDWILTSGLTQSEIVAIQVPGWQGQRERVQEIERLFAIYVDVERQLRTSGDRSLDLAVDALMKRPELAREVLDGKVASAGTYADPVPVVVTR